MPQGSPESQSGENSLQGHFAAKFVKHDNEELDFEDTPDLLTEEDGPVETSSPSAVTERWRSTTQDEGFTKQTFTYTTSDPMEEQVLKKFPKKSLTKGKAILIWETDQIPSGSKPKDDLPQVQEYEGLILDDVQFVRINERSHVVAIAIDKHDPSRNGFGRIHCMGQPLGGYVYDAVQDTYEIRCCDMVELGSIPVAYKMRIRDNSAWEVLVPLPTSLIVRCMSPEQRKAFQVFRNKYSNERFSIEFVQAIGC
jgi:hypothetical protein